MDNLPRCSDDLLQFGDEGISSNQLLASPSPERSSAHSIAEGVETGRDSTRFLSPASIPTAWTLSLGRRSLFSQRAATMGHCGRNAFSLRLSCGTELHLQRDEPSRHDMD